MIVNNEIIRNKFACKARLALYLIEKCKIPILSYDDNYIYFADTERLRNALDTLPLYYKAMKFLNL